MIVSTNSEHFKVQPALLSHINNKEGDGEGEGDSKLFLSQSIVALVMFIAVLGFTFCPYWVITYLKRNQPSSGFHSSRSVSRHCLVISLGRLSCFTGGVFISTGFLDLFPEVEEYLKDGSKKLGFDLEYPLAPFFTLLGFFVFLTIEQIILISKERMLNDGGHTHASSAPRQSKVRTMGTTNTTDSSTSAVNPHSSSNHEPNGYLSENTPLLRNAHSQPSSTTPTYNSAMAGFGRQHSSEARPPCESCASRDSTLEHCEHSMGGISDVPVVHTHCDQSINRLSSIHKVGHHHHHQSQSLMEVPPPTPESGSFPPHLHHHHSHEGDVNPVLLVHRTLSVSSTSSTSSSSSSGGEMVHSHFSELPQHGSLRTVVLVLAICIHAVFEGLALGLQTSTDDFFKLLVALLLHKGVIAAGIGLNLATSTFPRWLCVVVSIIFSAASPLGIMIGLLIHWQSGVHNLTGQAQMVSGSLQGLACGTFFYIVFFEILPHEFNSGVDRMGKLLSLCLGFCLVSVYLLYEN